MFTTTFQEKIHEWLFVRYSAQKMNGIHSSNARETQPKPTGTIIGVKNELTTVIIC